MQYDKTKHDELTSKRENGEPLKPAEKALLAQFDKAVRKAQTGTKAKEEQKAEKQTNLVGTINSDNSIVKAKLVRFVQIERRGLKSQQQTLLAEHADEIKQSLGSLKALSEDLLIRAAVLGLNGMSEKKIITLLKQAQMNS